MERRNPLEVKTVHCVIRYRILKKSWDLIRARVAAQTTVVLSNASTTLELLVLDQARDAREVKRPDFNLEVGPTFSDHFHVLLKSVISNTVHADIIK